MPRKAAVAAVAQSSTETAECIRWLEKLSSPSLKSEALREDLAVGNFPFDFAGFINNGNCISIDARSLHETNVLKLVDFIREKGFLKDVFFFKTYY